LAETRRRLILVVTLCPDEDIPPPIRCHPAAGPLPG
jgi:hypothetical protein